MQQSSSPGAISLTSGSSDASPDERYQSQNANFALDTPGDVKSLGRVRELDSVLEVDVSRDKKMFSNQMKDQDRASEASTATETSKPESDFGTSFHDDIVSVSDQRLDSVSTNDNLAGKDFEEVKQVDLFGSAIVALTINGRERLCLAQISNTLLKDFSYNEIHNRRVALGITCVQCTPIQLEMLRRAGAMPSSSRRCGMITRREAERLCRSFLVEEQPPELPENFYFTVAHRVNYGCKGRFVPARYISSRAKCIECFFCGGYYSPNKFIFHSHKQPHATDCNPPDSPNINSWRKHIDLDWSQDHSQEVRYAWEDVKSLFNGGTRRRAPSSSNCNYSDSSSGVAKFSHNSTHARNLYLRNDDTSQADEDQLIDVEFDSSTKTLTRQTSSSAGRAVETSTKPTDTNAPNRKSLHPKSRWTPHMDMRANHQDSLMIRPGTQAGVQIPPEHPIKRLCHNPSSPSKSQRMSELRGLRVTEMDTRHRIGAHSMGSSSHQEIQRPLNVMTSAGHLDSTQPSTVDPFLTPASSQNSAQSQAVPTKSQQGIQCSNPNSSFIYNQLYSQLMQCQRPANQLQINQTMETQAAIRHHLWSSLLANLQCANSNDSYGIAGKQIQSSQHQAAIIQQFQPQIAGIDLTATAGPNFAYLPTQLHNIQQLSKAQTVKVNQEEETEARFHLHKFSGNPGNL